jgi:hypothetical protein
VRYVGLDRRFRYEQFLGDFGIGESAGQQTKDLGLAVGQIIESFDRPVRVGTGGETLDDSTGDGRSEKGVPAGHDANRRDQVISRSVFE